MIFKPTDRERAIKFIDTLISKGKHIKIEHIPEVKTISQNGYLWLIFTHLGFETGATKEDMHDYYLNRFPRFKEVEHLGETVNVRITLRSFSKEQMSSFIDEVVTDARQEGFDIPDCESYNARLMMDHYRKLGII
jgi:hypothetical protein